MISEFIWLELIEQTKNGILCSCNLPNPDLDSDEKMVVCGRIEYLYDLELDCDILKINMFNNFKCLCVGDTYQRKNFVQTIVLALNMKYKIHMQNIHITLSDCWGTYSGDLTAIDEIYRGVD